MRVLLALLPYIASVAFYWLNTHDLFRQEGGVASTSTGWRLAMPVLIGGGLTPLALAAKVKAHSALFLSAAGFGMLFTFAVFALVRNSGGFARLYRPVALGRYRIRFLLGRRVLGAAGALVISYGAVITVVASR
jgi:hypothetical protein